MRSRIAAVCVSSSHPPPRCCPPPSFPPKSPNVSRPFPLRTDEASGEEGAKNLQSSGEELERSADYDINPDYADMYEIYSAAKREREG